MLLIAGSRCAAARKRHTEDLGDTRAMSSILRGPFAGAPWFDSLTSYIGSRLDAIELRLQTALRFVDLHPDNGPTFSYEFASLTRDAAGAWGSAIHGLINGPNGTNLSTGFADYRKFLIQHDLDVTRRSLQLRPLSPSGIVVPFESLADTSTAPRWWSAHNKLKHSEHAHFQVGTLFNAIEATAALRLLGHYVGIGATASIWVNVGIVYPPDSIDMAIERRFVAPT